MPPRRSAGSSASSRATESPLSSELTKVSLDQTLSRASKALVLGIGGGGDVVGALAAARMCQAFGCEFVLGGVAWERLPIDPVPGPRPVSEIRGADPLSDCVVLARESTTTPEGVPFSESAMAGYLCSPTVLVDITPGPAAVAEGIEQAAARLGCDLILCVDVGGDVLGRGDEPNLASPLCDAIMLAAAAKTASRVPTLLGVVGAGCDGELTPEEVMLRTAELATGGAWMGTWGVGPAVADQIEAAAARTGTEASALITRCARGEIGETPIRRGRRSVQLSPLGAMLLLFDPARAVEVACPLAGAVADASDLEEARAALAARGVRTELDYERDNEPGA